MTRYIELNVRTAIIVHGYDNNNQPIEEAVHEQAYVKKLIALERIQSITEQYVLVTSSHGRVMYWEYDITLQQLKDILIKHGLLVQ